MRKIMALLAVLGLGLLCACGPTASTPPSETTQPLEDMQPGPGSPPEGGTEPEPETPPPAAQTHSPLPEEVVARMVGSSWNEDSPVALEDLCYLRVPYIDFAGETQLGEMVVHQALAGEVQEIFAELFAARFPLAEMVLVDEYGADDLLSMAANNCYAFCSRRILGTDRYSVHSYGSAVDINPVQNPYVTGGSVYPEAAAEYMDRADMRPGMVTEGDVVYEAFTSRGWSWGGHWQSPDYQHFEKEIA